MHQKVLLVLLSVVSTIVRAQCPDGSTIARQIRILKDAPTEQLLPIGLRLKKQLEACGATRDSSYAEIVFQLGYAYSLAGNNKLASQLTLTSIRINEKKRPDTAPLRQVQAYFYLGNYLWANNQSTEAFDAYQRCITLGYQLVGDPSFITRSLIGQARVLYLRGDYEQALRKANESYQTAITQKDNLLLAECLIEIARNDVSLGKLAVAGKAAQTAIRLAATDPYGIDVENVGRGILAIVFRNQNRPVDALREYERTAVAFRKMGDLDQAAHTYNSMGYLYRKGLADYDRAQFYFEKAYADFRESQNKALCLDNLGVLFNVRHQYENALMYFQRALSLLPIGFTGKNNTQNPPAQVIRLIAHEEILLSIIQDKADTWLDYAKTTSNRQLYAQRLRHALNTYRVTDEMIDIMRWQHTGQQSKLYWREKTHDMYERAIETSYRLGDTKQAFRFFEKSRAVMLADKINELGARQKLAPAQVAEEQRLRQIVAGRQRKLAGLTADNDAYKATQQALIVSQDSLADFIRRIETSNSAYYQDKYDNTTASLADLKSYLINQNATFVTYFEGDSARYVLSVTPTNASLLRQQKGTYQKDAQTFMRLLADPDALNRRSNVTQFLQLGNQLYRQALLPLKLAAGRVIVSPDGSFVPFETFSRSGDQPDYLVRDYAFSYVYSAKLLLRTDGYKLGSGIVQPADFLGVAPVSFAATLKQVTLAGSDRALQPIADRFRTATILTQQAATRRAFLEQAADARIIHLFTHAIADSSDREPVIFLADSSLRLSDFGDDGLPNARMVVLAACKTGIGANQRGEGVLSLARGFAALGVPSILTTLWSVDNDATYKLTNLFYKYLAENLPKDIALQRAQQEWLRTADGIDQLPTYWAGLIVVGDAEPISQRNQWRWIAGGALLIAGGLIGWLWRRKRTRLSGR